MPLINKINALGLRQSLGRVLVQLARTGQPILVEKDRKPAAVLISLRDYEERFVDREADEARRALAQKIAKLRRPAKKSSTAAVRALRGKLP